MARWTHREIRQLLALARQPEKLESEPLGMLLREAMHASSVQAALTLIVERALPINAPSDELLRKVIAAPDAGRSKSRQTAHALGLSLRSYFRYRAAAVDAVASAIDRVLRANPKNTRYEIQLAEMVSRFNPEVAFDVLSRTFDKPSGQIAYELLCSAIKAGRPVTKELVNRCEGRWRTLAMVALARQQVIGGQPRLARRWRNKMTRALEQLRTPVDHSAAFELAHFDRLEAIRRCDMAAAREAARQMSWHARSNSELAGLALVTEVEQACDDGDLERANVVLRRLADFNAATRDYQVMARTAHVQALVALMQGSWNQALDLARLAATALTAAETGYSICAHANVGRAALLLGQDWQPLPDLLNRFARCWIIGMSLAVQSRHLLAKEPARAVRVAQQAVAVAKAQEALGIVSFARASLAFALDATGATAEAQAELVGAWELAVRLGRQSYLYDIFVHPRMQRRSLGAFTASPPFFEAIQRRVKDLVAGGSGSVPPSAALAAGSIAVRSLAAVIQPVTASAIVLPAKAPARSGRKTNHFDLAYSGLSKFVAPKLANDLASCLPHAERERFSERWIAAITEAAKEADGGRANALIAAS